MMLKQRNSIEMRIARSLLFYTLFTVLLLWVFQVLFLNTYYHALRRKSIIKAGSEIISCISAENFDERLENICYTHGMCTLIIDEHGTEVNSVDMLGRRCLIHSPAKFSLPNIIEPVLKGEQNMLVLTVSDKHFHNETLIYAAAVTNPQRERVIIVLNANLDPVESTVWILKSQLRIITAVLVILAIIMSKIVARKLSKPIQNITKKAKRLANGDYIADYTGGGITEVEELAQALNFSAEGLSKVEELRRELIANVSHDLKTPLTMIKAYAEMIRDLTGDDKASRDEQLEVIISESDRLTALVTDLIRTSREEQQREYKKEAFSIKQKIDDIVSRFSQLYPDYHIISETESEKAAIGDTESIGQVLYNLISNAINYTGSDKTVRIKLFETPQAALRVEISDSGRGIPQEELPLIWERYYRSKNTHQRPVAGTGLGLSIVKSALTGQNLKFGVRSEIGRGSCFWFELPTENN